MTHRIVVIEHQSEIVAFATVNPQQRLLSQLFVASDCKRKGIGKQLMYWVSAQCPDGFTLKTAADNSESNAFYQALGFVEVSRSINDFNGREEIEYA